MTAPGIVVVTGAGGFVGRALIARFAADGCAFRAIVRRHDPSSPERPHWHALGDLATVSDADLDAMIEGAAAVVHLAGRAHRLDETSGDAATAYATANATATERVARAAIRADVRRFVFASTVKVNGEASAPTRPFRPDDPPAPGDDYAKSKLAAERALAAVCAGTTMAPIVLRLPLVYGPGVKANFARLLDEVAGERRLPLGAIRNHRSILYVGNLIDAIVAALEAPLPPSGVHFVADAERPSVPELLAAAGAALGVPLHLFAVPIWMLRFGGAITGQSARVARLTGTLEVETSSFVAATGWRPRYALAEGLSETARWWRMRHSI